VPLVKAARKYQRVVQTGSQQRSMEMNRFACELVRDGGIGKVRKVQCVNYPRSVPYVAADFPEEPVPPGLNWDLSIALGHLQNWLDCIQSRGKPTADVEIGHRSASVGHIINIVGQVGQLGETLNWDPVSERFTNSEQGNQLLDRPRRKGWELPEEHPSAFCRRSCRLQ
jgi:hypothetical protein